MMNAALSRASVKATRQLEGVSRFFRRAIHITLLIPISVMCLFVRSRAPQLMPAQSTALEPTSPGFESPLAAAGREIFAKRLEHYQATHESLNNLVYLSLICIGVTVAVLAKREKGSRPEKEYALEFQGVRVPVGVAYLAISVVMTYVWVQYIFTLNHLVTERRELWDMLTWLQGNSAEARRLSLLPLLQGSPLIDAWAQAFQPDRFVMSPASTSSDIGKTVNGAIIIAILGGVAAAVGLAHASVFAILDDVSRRWSLTKFKRVVVAAARIALCAVIVCAYVWFELANRDWWFSIAAAWFAYVWVKLRHLLPSADSADRQLVKDRQGGLADTAAPETLGDLSATS
jgi:hypothetical protein